MSYTFFCGGASIGVFFEYSDYIKFIENEGHYKHIPNPIFKSLKYLMLAGIFAAIHFYLVQTYYDHYVITEDFGKLTLL